MLSPDQLRQYAAVRHSAGLVDRYLRGRLVLRGGDRKTFLHALLTNDIAALGPNDGCYAALLTPQGRMITDMNVFETGEATLLDLPREVKDAVLARLDQLIFSEDVQVGDMTEALGCAAILGPDAAATIGRALGAGAAAAEWDLWPQYRNARIDLDGVPGVLARVDESGLPGFLLFAPPTRLPGIAGALAAAGAVVPDEAVLETLRIEHGTPRFLVDMTGETIPLEAGIEGRAISYTKGCFPGQEIIVRIRDRGHGRVARKLVALTIGGEIEAASGDVIRAGGKDVGFVTSAAFSPAHESPVALGYVQRDHAAAGTSLEIVRGGSVLLAVVTEPVR